MNKIKVPYLEELKLYLNQGKPVLKDSGQSTSVLKEKLNKSDSDGSLDINDFLSTSSEDIRLSPKKRVHFSQDDNFFEQFKRTIEKIDPLEGIEAIWCFDAFDFGSLTSSALLEQMQPSENLQDKLINEFKSLTLNIFYPNEDEKLNDPTIINFIPFENDSAVPNLEMRLFFDLEKHKNIIQNKNLDLIVKK